MNIFRTDQQVAMNDLYVKIRESSDHYEDAADYLDKRGLSEVLNEIAAQRKIMSQKVKAVLRTQDAPPSEPDPDRESLEQLFHHISALVSTDQTFKLLEQRLIAEKEIARSVVDARSAGLDDICAAVVNEVEEHAQTVTRQLQCLLKCHNG